MPSVLLRSPFEGPWLRLRDAIETVTARTPEEVVGALDTAEAAATRGYYVAGFVTYEAAAAFDLAVHARPTQNLPLVWFGVFPPEHVERLTDLPTMRRDPGSGARDPWSASISRPAYVETVERIKTLIADGETYQLNFTFRLRTTHAGAAESLFSSLVDAQGGAWSAFVDLGDTAICSASPELFFTRSDGRIECRPMKGTLPRGLWADDDRAQGERLRESAKNRAENVMIVDLVRNDLGRVADVGSVTVESLFDVERFPAQWQMTSTIAAHAPEASIARIFAALFPSGSVTGAPKPRSMEIIRDLERHPRGIYTGAVGLIAPDGRAHFNIAIRTAVVDRRTGQAEFGVGSGIVWESNAADEFEECQVKAGILTAARPQFEILETMRWDPAGGFRLLSRHLDRARQTAEYFGVRFREHDIRNCLQHALKGMTTAARIRLLLDREGHSRCDVADLIEKPGPWRVALAAAPVSSRDVFLYHKTTNRAAYDAARRSRPDADMVILWNEAGEITEGTDANVVVEIDGQRVTPPVSSGLLAGTMRADLLERGEIVERRISKEEFLVAQSIWLINSVRGWMNAVLVP